LSDELLTPQDIEEALSRAFVQAIAARAGYTISYSDFDRDGIDIEIKAGGLFRPRIDAQLKATVNLGDSNNGVFKYALNRRNYDLLRAATQSPRILIVLALPKDPQRWLTLTTEELILRRCAYWCSLKGAPESSNKASVTVDVRDTNVFGIESLKALMEQSRRGSVE
jgi:hypothetical protein